MVKLLLYIHLPVTYPIGQCLQSVVPRMPSHVLLVYRYIATGKEYIVQLYSTNSLNSVMQYHPSTNTQELQTQLLMQFLPAWEFLNTVIL